MPQQQLSRTNSNTNNRTTPTSSRQHEFYVSMLSHDSIKPKECIPVNKDGDRIDTSLPQPPDEDWLVYNRRAKQHKLCNGYHLGGECGNLSCEFDHSEVDDTSLAVMRYIMRQHPCPNGPSCRSVKCYMGHLCQKPGCKGQQCRFKSPAHNIDTDVVQLDIAIESDVASPVSGAKDEWIIEDVDPNNSFASLTRD